jgi:hypothetical protein
MLDGGRTWREELGILSRKRLELDHEKHTVVQLPCCGTSYEVTDTTVDNYITCPNPKCMKHHVLLSGLNPKIRSEVADNDSPKRLIY